MDKSFRSDPDNAAWVSLAEFLGVDRDDEGAMSEATYYACTKILREALGKMPFRLMQRTDVGGVEVAEGHPLYRTMCLRPNPYMTATAFWGDMEQCRNHYGNAYARITGTGTRKDPIQLWPMRPEEVDVWYDDAMILSDQPDIYYRWTSGGKLYVLKSCEVLHLRSSDSVDGIMGIPLIDRLKSLVGGAVKAQSFQNELIGSGLTAKAVLQYTADLSPENVKTFTSGIENYAKGEVDKVRNIIPIPVGCQLTPLNTKLTDAQFEELKKYSAVQIASAFGIKPQQIGDMTKTSYASSQAQQEAFYTDTLLYILRHYEDEASFKLLTPSMTARGYFTQFDTDVVLRCNFQQMVEACVKGIQGSVMKPNEARDKLNLPADPDGDTLLGNGSLIPVGMMGEQYIPDAAEGGDDDGRDDEQGDGEDGQGEEPDGER